MLASSEFTPTKKREGILMFHISLGMVRNFLYRNRYISLALALAIASGGVYGTYTLFSQKPKGANVIPVSSSSDVSSKTDSINDYISSSETNSFMSASSVTAILSSSSEVNTSSSDNTSSKKATDDAASKKAADDAESKKAADDTAAKKAAEDAAAKKAADDAVAKKAAEDAAAKKAADDAAAKKAAEDAASKKAADDAAADARTPWPTGGSSYGTVGDRAIIVLHGGENYRITSVSIQIVSGPKPNYTISSDHEVNFTNSGISESNVTLEVTSNVTGKKITLGIYKIFFTD